MTWLWVIDYLLDLSALVRSFSLQPCRSASRGRKVMYGINHSPTSSRKGYVFSLRYSGWPPLKRPSLTECLPLAVSTLALKNENTFYELSQGLFEMDETF